MITFVAGAGLDEFRDERVTVVVRAALHPSLLADLAPGCFERRDRARRIFREGRAEGEDKPLRAALPEPLRIPRCVLSSAAMALSFSGITRPVPASVFDLPTVRAFF
jgi:hypothetical protein